MKMIKLFLRQITHNFKDELSPDIIYLVFRWITTCFDQNWFSVQLSIRPWRHADKGIICSQILIKAKNIDNERIRVTLFCMASRNDLENIWQLLLHRSILWENSGMLKQLISVSLEWIILFILSSTLYLHLGEATII